MTAIPAGTAVAWAPEGLPIATRDAGRWSYVVLEEIVDGIALLRRWAWPVADPLGRLLWPGGSEHRNDSATVPVTLLKVQLYDPNGLVRQPRCGDTYGLPPGAPVPWRNGRERRDLRDVFGDAVYDISADAREAVKTAYQSSLGAVQPAGTAGPAARTAVAEVLEHRARNVLPRLAVGAPPSSNGHRSRS
jgi:hypothetical protein